MQTLLLDTQAWDLLVDASGNIAVASDPYSQAQDAASAIKTFRGEAYYDVDLGLTYWPDILGKAPPLSLVKAEMVAAALLVPGVAAAKCVVTRFRDRHLEGQVLIVNDGNQSALVGI